MQNQFNCRHYSRAERSAVESPITKRGITLRRIHIHRASGPRFVSSPRDLLKRTNVREVVTSCTVVDRAQRGWERNVEQRYLAFVLSSFMLARYPSLCRRDSAASTFPPSVKLSRPNRAVSRSSRNQARLPIILQ